MDKSQKEIFLSQMIEQVKELSVRDVVGSVVDLSQRGQYFFGLCPFHPDHNLGSFVVTPSKNLWRCFAENIGGGPIQFEMKYYEIPFLEACFKLALEYGIITKQERDTYSRRKWDERFVRDVQKSTEKEEKPARQAPAYICYMVNNAIAAVCDLSEEHKQHLLTERGLTEEDLKDYFTFPTRRTNLAGRVMDYLEKRLRETMPPEKAEKYIAETDRELPYVPGFFKNKETGRVDFAANRGIGFVVRDARGHALGIQIRRDRVKKGESRYIWFSSSFARAKDNCEGGASPGSPGGVIFPKPSAKRPAVCITEGRFKAVKIAEKGNIAIYVSGVSTWKKILPILDSIIADRKKVYLLFDSDMLGNAAVYGQLEALAEALKERQLSPVPVMWAIENGKGFDDLVNAHPGGYKSLLRYVNFADFKKKYTEALKDTLSAFNAARIRDIKKKDAQAFAEALQKNMEKIFELKK